MTDETLGITVTLDSVADVAPQLSLDGMVGARQGCESPVARVSPSPSRADGHRKVAAEATRSVPDARDPIAGQDHVADANVTVPANSRADGHPRAVKTNQIVPDARELAAADVGQFRVADKASNTALSTPQRHGPDPRMLLMLPSHARRGPEVHAYRVMVAGCDVLISACRHSAMQRYFAERRRMNDFAEYVPPDGARMFADGIEYFDGLPGPGARCGISARSWFGKPLPRERRLP